MKTADNFKIVNLKPEEDLYLIVEQNVVSAVPVITREGNNFYLRLHSRELWEGNANHRGSGYLDWEIKDLFKSKQKATLEVAKRLRAKAKKLQDEAKSLELGLN